MGIWEGMGPTCGVSAWQPRRQIIRSGSVADKTGGRRQAIKYQTGVRTGTATVNDLHTLLIKLPRLNNCGNALVHISMSLSIKPIGWSLLHPYLPETLNPVPPP